VTAPQPRLKLAKVPAGGGKRAFPDRLPLHSVPHRNNCVHWIENPSRRTFESLVYQSAGAIKQSTGIP